MLTKYCHKCKQYKPLCNFARDKFQKDGLQHQCRDCAKSYYLGHRLKRIEYVKMYRGTSNGKRVHLEASRRYREFHKATIAKQRKAYYRTLKGRLYVCFNGIKRRCNISASKDYKWYGGKGVCCLFASFDEFYDYITVDLGCNTIEKLKRKEIDRVDNNSHYMKGNIRFVSHKENCNNRRSYPANRKRRE